MPDFSRMHRFEPVGKVNDEDKLPENVKINIKRGLPQIEQHPPSGGTALLVCGGPSLDETELREAVDAGGKIVCVNGTYNWCLEHNLHPSAVVILDGREFNRKFIDRAVPGCKYLLASQCHPCLFDLCRDREVHIWHAVSCEAELEALKEQYDHFWPIDVGTTVGIRAITLLTVLGWNRIDIFGLDSCWLERKHHAYEQPENKERLIRVWLRPKDRDDLAQMFLCAPWHVQQANDFQSLVKLRGDHFDLNVRGPGLIASMLRTGAQIMES